MVVLKIIGLKSINAIRFGNAIKPFITSAINQIKFNSVVAPNGITMIHNILYFRGLDKKQAVLLTHGDSVEKVAENFKSIANSSTTIAGIANEKAHIYGLQFHPEVG